MYATSHDLSQIPNFSSIVITSPMCLSVSLDFSHFLSATFFLSYRLMKRDALHTNSRLFSDFFFIQSCKTSETSFNMNDIIRISFRMIRVGRPSFFSFLMKLKNRILMFEGAALSFFFLHLASFFLRAFLLVFSEPSKRPLVFFFPPFFDSPLFSRGRFSKFFFIWPLVLTQA